MLRSRSNQHLGINARIFYFHGLLDPSISFSNNEQIFSQNVRGQNLYGAKGRFDLGIGYDSKEGFLDHLN
jgi:hypothetical protein